MCSESKLEAVFYCLVRGLFILVHCFADGIYLEMDAQSTCVIYFPLDENVFSVVFSK